jgi:endo-1,4-beta-xylanase
MRATNLIVHKLFLTAVLCIFLLAPAVAQNPVIVLWPNGAPGSEGKTGKEKVRIYENGEHIFSNVHQPSITVYLPAKDKPTGAGVVVIPGGGHREIWMDHEGYNVAQWLSDHGVAAFILKYRLAKEDGSTYTIEGTELKDVQRAIRLVRNHAQEWGLDKERIGVIGFSAGGELAALASIRFDSGTPNSTDSIERESSKPNFQGLIYPGLPHDMDLSAQTPPAFLACGEDDRPEISKGVPELYLNMKAAGISAELHVYAHTGHGFGVRANNPPPVSGWMQNFFDWMGILGMLKHN